MNEQRPGSAPSDDDLPRDPRLRAALRHAPDRDAAAPPALGQALRRQARDAVASEPARDRAGGWRRWLNPWPTPRLASALGSLGLAVLIGVMWREGPPPSPTVLDEAPMAPTPVAQGRPPVEAADTAAKPPGPDRQLPTPATRADARPMPAPARNVQAKREAAPPVAEPRSEAPPAAAPAAPAAPVPQSAPPPPAAAQAPPAPTTSVPPAAPAAKARLEDAPANAALGRAIAPTGEAREAREAGEARETERASRARPAAAAPADPLAEALSARALASPASPQPALAERLARLRERAAGRWQPLAEPLPAGLGEPLLDDQGRLLGRLLETETTVTWQPAAPGPGWRAELR